jgi:hypothetical protein
MVAVEEGSVSERLGPRARDRINDMAMDHAGGSLSPLEAWERRVSGDESFYRRLSVLGYELL